MAVTTQEYNHFKDVCLDDLDWNTSTFKIALLDNTHIPDLADTILTDVTADECVGAGYVAGGQVLDGMTITGGQVTVNPETFTAITASVRYVVLYASGTVHGLTNPLLLIYDLGSEIVLSAVDWTFSWTGNVLYELT